LTVISEIPRFWVDSDLKIKKTTPLVNVKLNKPKLLVSSGVSKDIIKAQIHSPIFKILKIRGILKRGEWIFTLMMSI
jgi:hypothetical protein